VPLVGRVLNIFGGLSIENIRDSEWLRMEGKEALHRRRGDTNSPFTRSIKRDGCAGGLDRVPRHLRETFSIGHRSRRDESHVEKTVRNGDAGGSGPISEACDTLR